MGFGGVEIPAIARAGSNSWVPGRSGVLVFDNHDPMATVTTMMINSVVNNFAKPIQLMASLPSRFFRCKYPITINKIVAAVFPVTM